MTTKLLKLYISIAFCAACILLHAQQTKNENQGKLFDDYMQYAESLESKDDLLIKTALYFLGRPYVGGTLETSEKEQLLVNLQEFDCVTFVETCLALSKTAAMNNGRFEQFCHELQKIRYRNGIVDGYSSRLHYSSDWIYENELRAFAKNISKEIGGDALEVNVSFMSEHAESYKHLKNNPDEIERIKQIENNINNRKELYYYIPKEKINDLSDKIQNGDILFFTSSIKGLDISHLGIAYWENNSLRFIHASSKYKKVVIEPQSLQSYCSEQKKNTGIVVLRLEKSFH